MATAALHHSPVAGRAAVASWIGDGIEILLTALLGTVAAAQLRMTAALIGQSRSVPWLGALLR
jgi:hypothetical protein